MRRIIGVVPLLLSFSTIVYGDTSSNADNSAPAPATVPSTSPSAAPSTSLSSSAPPAPPASSSSASSSSSSASASASSSSSPRTGDVSTALAPRSAKRGLIYIDPTIATDDNYWTTSSNDLTWYYNYAATPEGGAFAKSNLQFVPMQWGAPAKNPDVDTSFYDAVNQMQKNGQNITWVLGFNEPDGCANGGSCVDPKTAATAWVKQFEPMRSQLNVKLGGPACTGGDSGWTWLQAFHTACAALKNDNSGCEMDFLPIHWYGSFDGLAGHLGRVNSTYGNNISDIWVTEFAYDNEDLADTQSFYNSSTQYFDRLDIIGKYSYFGSFRSDVSNVGPNVPFLDQNGNLTDIGAWYLGYPPTGNIPSSTGGTGGIRASAIVNGAYGIYTGKPFSGANMNGINSGLVGSLLMGLSWLLF